MDVQQNNENGSGGLKLSVLDQSPISEGSNGSEALHNSLDLARLTDDLGYHRYWVAEHHGSVMLACASPEVLIGPIAAATKRIRVGSGGVMLPHYSPFKVAENFSMLSGLFPGRIDLGLGRAAGTDPTTSVALQRDRRYHSPDDFPEQLTELLAYFDNALPSEHPFARLALLPGRPELPQPWLLGSSPQSGIWAAELGLPYAFADFINPNGGPIARRYREQLTAARALAAPRMIVAASVICAESDEEAQRLAASSQMLFTLLLRGRLIAVPPVETALQFLATQIDTLTSAGRRYITGSPSAVREGIESLAAEYNADEVMIVTITHDHDARRRSYELIAEAFGLR